jgi:hypothetical protein
MFSRMKISLLITTATILATGAFAQDVADLLSEAQRAYVRGDVKAAKEKFDLVLKVDPNNRIAISHKRRILAEEAKDAAQKGPVNATKAMLESVKIPKIDFREAALGDALEFLKKKGNQIAGEKAQINFVMQLDEATKAKKITLTLQDVPFTEVVRYMGQLADVEFSYEAFAIVVRQKGAGAAPATTAK